MQQKNTWFSEQAFGKQAESQSTIEFEAHSRALTYLKKTLQETGGIALLQGPQGSGKNRIIGRYTKGNSSACAVVDATRLTAEDFLSRVVAEFGYVAELSSTDELLQMVEVFAGQQVRSSQAPVLVVENVDRMVPAALDALAALAAHAVNDQFAIRMILSSDRELDPILSSETLSNVARRASEPHVVETISPTESMVYLYARMEACGIRQPDSVFPVDVCDRLHELSEGRPGRLNTLAIAALEKATAFPLNIADMAGLARPVIASAPQSPEKRGQAASGQAVPPSLIITQSGKSPLRYEFDNTRVLIGRSQLADIMIDDDFASKAHALLMLYSDALVLLDLNSTNGTLVNSVRASSTILRTDDIISLGHYRIKIENAPTADRDSPLAAAMASTAKMKNLQDMRQQKAQRSQKGDRTRRHKA